MPSLSFLKKLKNLEFFSFDNVNIEDGDVTPLLKLKNFGFYPNKRNYSHTMEELKKIHQERGLSVAPVRDENSGFYLLTFDNGTEYHGDGGMKQAEIMAKKIESESKIKIKLKQLRWTTKPSKEEIEKE